MRKARNRFERCRQVLGWLESNWPAGRNVELIWVKTVEDVDEDTGKVHQCHGQTYREGRAMVIELSLKKCRDWDTSTKTLMHEFAHVVQWGMAAVELDERTEHHPIWFYALLGEIENAWDHDHGHEAANEFEF